MEHVPHDPDDWTDEQWLAWLAEGDLLAEADTQERVGPSRRAAFMDGLGAKMLAASMRGLNDAIYGPKDEPAIVIDAAGDPPDPEGLDVRLDPDHPEQSIVVVRPWLLRHLNDERADREPQPPA